MTRSFCAGAFALVLLAGCASVDLVSFFALQSDGNGRDRVFVGSLDAVAQSTQNTLSQMGLAATMSRKGDAIYIASKSSSGASFTLLLTKEKSNGAEQTRVHVEWDGKQDDQTGFQVLANLESLTRR